MKYRKARDAAEPAIVDALRAAGASVHRLGDDARSGLPDLLVGAYGRTMLLEVKNPESKKPYRVKSGEVRETSRAATCLSPGQQRWHTGWRGEAVRIARTPQDALEALRALREAAPTLCDVLRASQAACHIPCQPDPEVP